MYNTQIYIDLSKLQTKFPEEILEILSCHICLGLAVQPCECAGCENVFCSSQIDMMKEKVCPICKTNNFKPFDSLHKSYKTFFRNVKLKCDSCESTLDYKEYLSHLDKCQKLSDKMIQAPPPIFYNYFFTTDADHMQYEPLDIVSMNVNLRDEVMQFQLGLYAIDLAKLVQTNVNTKYKRQIIQEKDSSHIEQAYWLVERNSNPNEPYDYDLQVGIETAYQTWMESKKAPGDEEFVFGIDERAYSIDFSLMTQTNLESKYSRAVKRIVI